MSPPRRPAARALTFALALAPALAPAAPTLEDYRYFRALSIDLQGRAPTRDEVAAFEQPGFDVDAWIDQKLQSPAYAERVRRAYEDLLRLEIGSSFQFVPGLTTLRRQSVLVEGGATVYVYFRQGQRRTREETDGAFCLTQAETGQQYPNNAAATGTAIPVSQTVLDANTVLVRPWWLFRDYKSASPSQRWSDAWRNLFPGFVPVDGLLSEPDGTATNAIRVCNEEAQTADTGTVFATGRTMAPPAGTPPPYGRLTQLPLDSTFARNHAGESISCTAGTALANSANCGCGVGLERCMPGDGPGFDPKAFTFPTRTPLGYENWFDESAQAQSSWLRYWWGQEAAHYLDAVLGEDRDFREVLTGRWTVVNGPLAQFYRGIAQATCCGNGTYFNYPEPAPLFDPARVPATLLPHDTSQWVRVDDRGPLASGILTMPVFLTKYGSRRGRAHVLYNAFLCRDFIAGNVQLAPSTEPNLMLRPGCSTCHATLEPIAAYFARVLESDWTYLPPEHFPLDNMTCAKDDPTRAPSYCRGYYDPAFTDASHALLRGSYGSAEHADAGPAGLGQYLANDPRFASCVAQNVAASFLGRPLTVEDDALEDQLTQAFTGGGYRMRALVGALLRSEAYRHANNLSSTLWREGGAM